MDTTNTAIGTDWEEIAIVGDTFRLQNIEGGAEVEIIVKELKNGITVHRIKLWNKFLILFRKCIIRNVLNHQLCIFSLKRMHL